MTEPCKTANLFVREILLRSVMRTEKRNHLAHMWKQNTSSLVDFSSILSMFRTFSGFPGSFFLGSVGVGLEYFLACMVFCLAEKLLSWERVISIGLPQISITNG